MGDLLRPVAAGPHRAPRIVYEDPNNMRASSGRLE